jgi:hypothetical protein
MIAYSMTYQTGSSKGLFNELTIETHPDLLTAAAYVASPKFADSKWAGISFDRAEDLSFGGPMLVQLYNHLRGATNPEAPDHLKKFESRARGQERVFALVEEKYLHQPHAAFEAPAKGDLPASSTTDGAEGAGLEEGTEDMAKKKAAKAAKKAKTTKPAGEKKPRGKGVGPGKVADFRQVREGTDRQKVLKLMNGQHTAEQIAQELGMESKKVGQIAFCISRDCGIGYSFSDKGRLTAEYPTGKSYKDAVKKAAAE